MTPKTQVTTYEVSLEDLKKMFAEKLGVNEKTVRIDDIQTRIEVPGLNPHDCDYVDNFTGIKITVTNQLVSA